MSNSFQFNAIATVQSPYKEKFGIPRQPGLAKSLNSRIVFLPEYTRPEIVRGLEGCSHIWVLFIFSECIDKGWTPTVRPPRLGGNKRMGVFSTRSPFRPNPIGLSPVELISIESGKGKLELVISGADLLDGTPIVDIKPYLPYSDQIPEAVFDLATEITTLDRDVFYSEQALQVIARSEEKFNQPVRQQINELLNCDPRPAYKKDDEEKIYGVRLYDMDIRFSISATDIRVLKIEQVD